MKNNYKDVYLVLEKDLDFKETDFSDIFITDSLDSVNELMQEYYGRLEELSYDDIRDSGLEYRKTFLIEGKYKVEILVKNYQLNQI